MSEFDDIVWWHFSDIHWKVGVSSERSRFLNILWSHLEATHGKFGSPDFIVITGDIVFNGLADEYDDVHKYFIEPLRSTTGRDNIPIFVVPGNHDLKRSVSKFIDTEVILKINSTTELDEFLDDPTALGMVELPFQPFLSFASDLMPPAKFHPLCWEAQIQAKGHEVFLLGGNSAWASSYYRGEDGNVRDERHLLVGQQQIISNTRSSENNQIRLYLQHHPLVYLKNTIEHRVRHHIQSNFHFNLFGHVHTVHDLATCLGPTGSCVYLPSPALYNRSGSDTIEYARGYNVITLNPITMNGSAYYYKYTNVYGEKFTEFSEIYEEGKKYFNFKADDPMNEMRMSSADSIGTVDDVLAQHARLSSIYTSFTKFVMNHHKYQHHAVDLYDNLCFDFAAGTGLIDALEAEMAWEAYLFVRCFLILQLISLGNTGRGEKNFDPRDTESTFAEFVDSLVLDQDCNINLEPRDYKTLSRISMAFELLPKIREGSVPGSYARYFATWQLFSQLLLYLDTPMMIPSLLRVDERLAGTTLDPDQVEPLNIMACRFNVRTGQLVIQLRICEKDSFLAVMTFKHFVDSFVRENVELWRQHHRLFPPLTITLEFPLWNEKSIASNYLNVETTPIVNLLMGKAMYGDVKNIWFREVLQNAMDAVSTRKAIEGDGYASEIQIRHDGDRLVSIYDNGIGMTYQHIMRYLTTLGRSIWASEEIEKSEQGNLAKTIGKFGIGFVSVFQDAERVYVRTRFCREVEEDGWLVDFTSVDKPFFTETSHPPVGTEVEIHLKRGLSPQAFTSLLSAFFLYLTDNIILPRGITIPKSLDDVVLHSAETLSKGNFLDRTTKEEINGNRFSLRTLFCYTYQKRDKKDILPVSLLQVANAGVNVFQQSELLLKPGKRYIWGSSEDEINKQSSYSQNEDAIQYAQVIIDFDKGYSPILPSRMEVDIEKEFSYELRNRIYSHYRVGLKETVNAIVAQCSDLKERRKKVLECLTFSVVRETSYWRRRGGSISSFSKDKDLDKTIINIYSKLCPLELTSLNGETMFIMLDDVIKGKRGIFVRDELMKTDLFKVYARSLKIEEWVNASSEREYFIHKMLLGEHGWKGLFEERDIYKERRQLFTEKSDSAIVSLIRADYAVIESDVFGEAAYVVLPANLPGTWRRSEAVGRTRKDVMGDCPARVLLNSRHDLIKALERAALNNTQDEVRETDMIRLMIDNLSDGVIEQRVKGNARERWRSLRKQIGLAAGMSLDTIPYEALTGNKSKR